MLFRLPTSRISGISGGEKTGKFSNARFGKKTEQRTILFFTNASMDVLFTAVTVGIQKAVAMLLT